MRVRVPRLRGRTFVDLFYNEDQQKRLRSNVVGRRVLGHVDMTGKFFYPPDVRRERYEIARAAGMPEEEIQRRQGGRHRRRQP